MVEQDDAIRHVLFEASLRQHAGFAAALSGDDGRQLPVFQPAKQAANLGAQHGRVGQAREERFDGVEHDALGADAVDGMTESDEQAFEVEVAVLLDFAALDAHEIDREQAPGHQIVEVEA